MKIIFEPFVTLDFHQRFPHKTWISTWSEDSEYPDVFRYKMFSTRIADQNMFEMVLLLEERNGNKKELERLLLSHTAVDRTCKIFIDGLSEEYGIDFDEHDFSNVTTSEEYEQRVGEFGWREWKQK